MASGPRRAGGPPPVGWQGLRGTVGPLQSGGIRLGAMGVGVRRGVIHRRYLGAGFPSYGKVRGHFHTDETKHQGKAHVEIGELMQNADHGHGTFRAW